MDANEKDANFLANKQDFAYFLSPDNGDSLYGDKVEEMVNDENKPNRLIINLQDINEYDPTLRRNLLQEPMQYIPAWQEALKDFINHSNFGTMKKAIDTINFQIGLQGSFGAQRLTPQRVMSNSIGTMVCVEGIVTKVSLVRPKVMETVHFCEATQQFHSQKYRDATSLTGVATGNSFPTTDGSGNTLTTEFGLCTFKDHQKVFIQDMPERTEAGSMPRTIECILDNDLVDSCKPGDRVQMIGIYRALSGSRATGQSSGRFHCVILANNIVKIGLGSESANKVSTLSANEIKNIKKMSRRKDVFSTLARSIVPSIYGHDFIKKAIVLQLLGGIAKDLDNGTHLRGDINILMVGDPSCGKSQLLRGVMNVAKLAINTTGRGSSGVGLTAAVTTDKESGIKRLEAGAMVLGDGGIVCIDEFDKMTDMDRTAIHEVMEQQTVTIAKAGIHTSLNARCSVIAAANPVYGMYDRFKKPHENIGLPDSLLSRFDLLFIVLDRIDTKIDKAISEHVLKMHLTPHNARDDNEYMGDEVEYMMGANDDEDCQVWSKKRVSKKHAIFTMEFVKKYIEFAKRQYKPVLTDEACEEIAQQYGALREEARNQTLPITARCLETVIRLSTAHAKMRLSKKVTIKDVEETMKVLTFALTNDADPEKKSSRRKDMVSQEDNEENGNNDDEDEEMGGSRRSQRRKRGKKKGDKREMDADDDDEDAKMGELDGDDNNATRKRRMPNDEMSEESHISKKVRTQSPEEEDDNETVKENVNFVTKYVSKYFREKRTSSVNIKELFEMIKSDKKDLTSEELMSIVKHLHEKNKIFFMDPVIHQI